MTNRQELSSYQVDWNEGRIDSSSVPLSRRTDETVTLTFCGDWGPRSTHATALRQDATRFYGDVLNCTGGSDLTIVNVEFPLRAEGESTLKEGPTHGIESDLLGTLTSLSCNVACLANNHMMDFGEQGLQSTVQALQKLGIQTVGAGSNLEESRRPLLQELRGVKLALVNIAEGEEAKATPSRAGAATFDVAFTCRQIADISKTVDIVIVVIHAGREFVPVPPPYIQAAYRAIAEAGATLIVAHHPHVPQGIEIWNSVPIFYSQGNFAFLNRKMTSEYRTLGYMVQAKVTKTGIHSIQIIPYKIEASGLGLLRGEARNSFLKELNTISSFLNPGALAAIWDAYADLWIKTKMSDEFGKILPLMSWQDLGASAAERLRGQAQGKNRVVRLFFRALATAVQISSGWLPKQNPPAMKSAAWFRNHLDTLAHRELYLNALQRLMDGRFGSSEPWARELLTIWRALD